MDGTSEGRFALLAEAAAQEVQDGCLHHQRQSGTRQARQRQCSQEPRPTAIYPPKKKRSCFLTSGLSRFSVSWGGLTALTGLSWLVFWFRLGSWVFDTLACNKFFGLSALRGNRNMSQCGQDSDRRWGRVDSCDQLELDRGHAC